MTPKEEVKHQIYTRVRQRLEEIAFLPYINQNMDIYSTITDAFQAYNDDLKAAIATVISEELVDDGQFEKNIGLTE
jgi:hypothetical protein